MHPSLLIAILALGQHGGAEAPPAAPPPGARSHAPGVPPGFAWDLYAREPLVSDPVAIAVDEQGRVFVAESERQERGVEDNRHCTWWLLDDLSNRTVADRLRMYEKWAGRFEGGMEHFTRWADRVRVLVDPGADGKPTRAVNFSGDLREPLDGTNAGVLVRDGEVWVTCIPNLWRFRDTDGDGVAEVRERIFEGFGVRIALRGHDMHGLVFGPDGRLYWSIGDRGYHLELPDGRVIADPKSGAVFRCEPDGSGLEVFCTGLRNPQELAFNRFGDLFTGDNNSDAGDKARIVWCVDGGETGWDMNYQTLEGSNQRGPWNQERFWTLWREQDAVDPLRAAWALPPLAHVSSGPSGLVAYPGVGFDDSWQDRFLLCDFLGDRASSRVLSFRARRDGAGYAVDEVRPIVTDVLPTDVDFDFAGRMLLSDWDEGWESKGRGQIYRVWNPRFVDSEPVRQVTEIMRRGVRELGDEALARLLAHPDMRVRLRAQWELARRGASGWSALADAVADGGDEMARLHGIWGLGQVLRTQPGGPGAAKLGAVLVEALASEEPEIRAQAAKVLGEAKWMPALEPLIALATDEDPRVRFFAAQALGRLGSKEAIPALVAILWENEDSNPYLRHAASLALARIGDREKLLELVADQFPQVRMGAVLALRRLHDPALARSIFDPQRRIATEAARAVHDLPIADARPALVTLAERWAAAGTAPTAEDAAPPIAVRREVWRPVPRSSSVDLIADPLFATPPTLAQDLEEFEAPRTDGNDFVQRLRGDFVAPASGSYRFAIASDDAGVLLLRVGDGEAKPVAKVAGYAPPGNYTSQPGQQSEPIELAAGDRVHLEARSAQGGGASHCSVRVMLPDGSLLEPIGRRPQPNLDAVPLLRRAIDECLREGSARGATALLGIAANPQVPMSMRLEALECLRLFSDPAARGPSVTGGDMVRTDPPIMRDRVNGHLRPVDFSSRDIEGFRRALSTRLPELASQGPAPLRALARTIAAEQGVALDPAAALATLRSDAASPKERAQCLAQLARQRHPESASLVEEALRSEAAELRMAARAILAETDPPSAVTELRAAMTAPSLDERRAALSLLARLGRDDADALLVESIRTAARGSLGWPAALDLDLLEASTARAGASPSVAEALAAWRGSSPSSGAPLYLELAMEGGDAERGREVVNFHSAAACLRCHAIEGHGGNAAPALDGVASRLSRADLLRSLVEPNAAIAATYTAPSAMPDMTTLLTPREARDVVEYLSTLRAPTTAAPH